ncbi:replication-relaxation family protein [Pseudoclavibacter sp. CFCC 11306]|uniref:replication-relaxation family protein n=1 Tax=Pseudoclavibacter sp. CFCC 11306 TaxID=1564493 RepID=UPI001300D078|nr:replication-relaxation family protein [Pseudoclavibacter sp. CFCC 11306]KAB1658171.1 hypothetical protein F8O09_00610 [Pseudoclavibacter sp. CFCC 11306]
MNLPQQWPTALSHPIHWRLAGGLARFRFATTTQLARDTADLYRNARTGVRQTIRHLHSLENHGIIQHLERRVGGWQGGSSVTIWALTTTGARLTTGTRARQRPGLLSTTFLEHQLAITEIRIRLAEITQTTGQTIAQLQGEPDCWRTYPAASGMQRTLRPDLAATITSQQFTDHYFFEADRATENPARVMRTCWQYAAYKTTGREQHATGIYPAVIWLTPTAERREQLQRYIDHEHGLPSYLFRVITMDGLETLIRNGPAP